MLCASDSPISAQDSEHNASGSSITQTSPLIHDPYDPRIDREYEILVHRWNHQLLQRSREFVSSLENPVITTKDAKAPPPLATVDTNEHQQWLMDMDRFFEELWLDAQHMLQCAQAWNYSSSLSSPTRTSADALSLNDAVRSMNIFGLRIMQRSLYARQTLLKSHRRQQTPTTDATTTKAPKNNNSYATMAVSPFLAFWKSSTEVTGTSRSVKVSHDKQDADQKRTIPAGSSTSLYIIPAEEEDEDDEQEMNAPLLRRTCQQGSASDYGCTSISCSCDDKSRQQSIKSAMQETMTTSSWVSLLPYPPVRQSTPCLPSIATTTAAATAAAATAGDGPSPTTVQRQHPQLGSSIAANARSPQMPPNRSAYGRGALSSSRRQYPCQSDDALSTSRNCSTGIVDEDGLWKSWFGDNNCGANSDSRPLHATTDTSHAISSGDYGGSNKHISQSVDDDDDDTAYLTAAYHRGLSDDDNESITSTKRRPAAAATTMAAAPCLPIDEKTEIESPTQEVRLHRFHQNSSSSNSAKDIVASYLIEPLSSLKMTRSCDFMSAMVRSESSISAFRPISKTLASDCCPREMSIAEDERPSPSSQELQIKPIPKSKSFPSKVAAFGIPARETFPAYPSGLVRSKALPHPTNSSLDNKERNFVMRSIVGKKASLTRLFSAKK